MIKIDIPGYGLRWKTQEKHFIMRAFPTDSSHNLKFDANQRK
jgi:hypothetical protein